MMNKRGPVTKWRRCPVFPTTYRVEFPVAKEMRGRSFEDSAPATLDIGFQQSTKAQLPAPGLGVPPGAAASPDVSAFTSSADSLSCGDSCTTSLSCCTAASLLPRTRYWYACKKWAAASLRCAPVYA